MQVEWYREQVAQEEQLSQKQQKQDHRESKVITLKPVRGWEKKQKTKKNTGVGKAER